MPCRVKHIQFCDLSLPKLQIHSLELQGNLLVRQLRDTNDKSFQPSYVGLLVQTQSFNSLGESGPSSSCCSAGWASGSGISGSNSGGDGDISTTLPIRTCNKKRDEWKMTGWTSYSNTIYTHQSRWPTLLALTAFFLQNRRKNVQTAKQRPENTTSTTHIRMRGTHRITVVPWHGTVAHRLAPSFFQYRNP